VIDGGKLRFAERAGHGHVPVQRIFRRVGIELFAVVKFHIRAQLDRYRQPVRCGLIA
jgi:hypothetical protein